MPITNRKSCQIIILLVFVLLLTLITTKHVLIAHADAAPPAPPVGSDLYPSIGNTNVRMESEYVLLDIAGNSNYPSGHANIAAQFFMRNLGDTEERMKVRFPMNHSVYDLDYEIENRDEFCVYTPYPSLNELNVWIDGEKVEVDITYETMFDHRASPDAGGNPVYITVPCWAHFDVTFPPNQDITIKVAYTVPGYDYNGYIAGEVEFAYVLGTGAGWKDSIAKVDIVARLPYDVNELNVTKCIPDDCSLSGKEVVWQYKDIEPSDNIGLRLIRPAIWQKVIAETENTQKKPDDGEAWGQLGKAYKEATIAAKGMLNLYESPGPELFDLSQAAYKKAVELLPNDADWHYGFADLLCNRAMWYESTIDNWFACVEQLKQALDLNPEHEKGNALLEDIAAHQTWDWIDLAIVNLSGTEPDYLILTPRPSATSTDTQPSIPTRTKLVKTSTPTSVIILESETVASPTPAPEMTLVVEKTNTVSVVDPDEGPNTLSDGIGSNWPIYAGTVLVIFVIASMVVIWRRK